MTDAGSRGGGSGAPGAPAAADAGAEISYADFGRRLIEAAVTRERVLETLAFAAGRPIDVGPVTAGPLGLVRVRATGAIGSPRVEDRPGELVSYELQVPVDLHLSVEIGFDRHVFDAAVVVRVPLTVRTAAPLLLVLDLTPPESRDVDVTVRADGLRSSVVQVLGNVDGEIRRQTAKVVRQEIEKPEVRAALVIDVAPALAGLRLSLPTAGS